MGRERNRRQFLRLAGGASSLGLAAYGVQSQKLKVRADEISGNGHGEHGAHDHGNETTETDGNGHDDDHGSGHHSEQVGPPVSEATVTMKSTSDGYHFHPHVVRVTQGGTVQWVCESGTHSTTAYHPDHGTPQRIPDGAAAWDSGTVSSPTAFEHTFEVEGVYDYYCRPHEQMGMVASVIVGEPDPHEQPALEPPQESFSPPVQEKIVQLNQTVNRALGHTH